MDFIIEYVLADATETRKVVVRNCVNVDEALKEFKQQYGAELSQRVISVFPTNL